MSTESAHHHRPWLASFNVLLAGGAAALAVVAITSDDVGSFTPPAVEFVPDSVATRRVPTAVIAVEDCGEHLRDDRSTPC